MSRTKMKPAKQVFQNIGSVLDHSLKRPVFLILNCFCRRSRNAAFTFYINLTGNSLHNA